jgi:hypothetical protein
MGCSAVRHTKCSAAISGLKLPNSSNSTCAMALATRSDNDGRSAIRRERNRLIQMRGGKLSSMRLDIVATCRSREPAHGGLASLACIAAISLLFSA